MTEQVDKSHRWLYPVLLMVRVLEVSVSGFYEYLRRIPAPATVRREQVPVQVKQVFTSSEFTYGYRRVYEKLIGDITYVRTKAGWLYLATVIDCYSRKVLGYAIDTHYRTSLIISAMEHAVKYRTIPAGRYFTVTKDQTI